MKLILEIYWSDGGEIGGNCGTEYYSIEDESVKQEEEDLFSLAYACLSNYLNEWDKGEFPGEAYDTFYFHKIPINWRDLFWYQKDARYKETNIKCWHYSAPRIQTLEDWFENRKNSQ